MAYNYVTVSGTFATLTGTVTFTPPNDVTDLTGTIPVLGPGPFPCTVSGGSFTSAPLLATDNVGLLPAGWTWLATVALTGKKAYSYPVLIPASAGTTATLSSLAVSASGGGSGGGLVNPMTTIGDVIVGGANGAAQRLASGGSAQVLTSNGAGATPTWQASTALANPMSALGDMIYGGTTPSGGSTARLAGGTVAAKQFLTQTGTGSVSAAPAWGTIASADVPVLNQNTSGTASNVTGVVAIVNGGTGGTTATIAYNTLSPMTTTGDIEVESANGVAARLGGNTGSTKNFLTSTGSGGTANTPAWGTIASADMPTGTTSAQGALQLNSTAGTIAAIAQQSAGVSPLAAAADHVHTIAAPAPWGSGYVAWTGDYNATPSLTTPTAAAYPSGALSLTRMDCPPGVSVGGTLAFTFNSGATLANTYLACFNSSGAQLGTVSSDLSALSANYHTTSVGAFTIPSNGIVYVVYLNGTDGTAGVRYFGNQVAITTGLNLVAPFRCSHLTGTITTMPSSLTGGNALSNFGSWYTYGWYGLY